MYLVSNKWWQFFLELPTRGAFLETMKTVVLTTIPLLSEFMKLKYSHDLAVTSKIYFNIQESCMYNCKYKKQNSSVKGNFKRNFNGRKINEMLDRSNPDKRYMIACSTFLLPFKRRKKIVPFLLLRYKYCSASSQYHVGIVWAVSSAAIRLILARL